MVGVGGRTRRLFTLSIFGAIVAFLMWECCDSRESGVPVTEAKKTRLGLFCMWWMVERMGFGPMVFQSRKTVLETAAIGHSANAPHSH